MVEFKPRLAEHGLGPIEGNPSFWAYRALLLQGKRTFKVLSRSGDRPGTTSFGFQASGDPESEWRAQLNAANPAVTQGPPGLRLMMLMALTDYGHEKEVRRMLTERCLSSILELLARSKDSPELLTSCPRRCTSGPISADSSRGWPIFEQVWLPLAQV